ncbi:MAG: SDR family NAD(P)-dependent oxidoreductase [Deltaproteobacteria bacterium]|nr:SDR family NAD(P)-dependent oxidoreductase [Deltaproteobacteria bacterium]
MKIKGTSAIVTGGASGLGEATVRELASAGTRVTIFDLNEERGQALAGETGGRFARVDVCREEDVLAGLEICSSSHGPPRILINCAGISGGFRTLSKGRSHPLEFFKKIIDINLVGTFNCIRLVAAEISKLEASEGGERGVIVNTSSINAQDGPLQMAAYSASKAGIEGMTLPIARDLANDGIRCCTIAPGIFDTLPVRSSGKEMVERLKLTTVYPKRFGEAAEFAQLARHICENQMLNGSTLRIDGAVRMCQK